MLDLEQLQALLALRRIDNASELAERTGVDRHTVSRLLGGQKAAEGVRWETMARIATVLGVPLDDLDCSTTRYRPWKRFSWQDLDQVNNSFEELNHVNSCLICTRGMDAYLQPSAMRSWSFTRAHIAAGWGQAAIDSALKTTQLSEPAGGIRPRFASNTVHHLIVRDTFLLDAFVIEPDWVSDAKHILSSLEGKTVIALVPSADWTMVDKLIQQAITKYIGYHRGWDKLCVADNTFALFRPSRDEYLVTYHSPTVKGLRACLETIALDYAPYNFPLRIGLRSLRVSVNDALKRMDRLALVANEKRKSPLVVQRADAVRWAELALRP